MGDLIQIDFDSGERVKMIEELTPLAQHNIRLIAELYNTQAEEYLTSEDYLSKIKAVKSSFASKDIEFLSNAIEKFNPKAIDSKEDLIIYIGIFELLIESLHKKQMQQESSEIPKEIKQKKSATILEFHPKK